MLVVRPAAREAEPTPGQATAAGGLMARSPAMLRIVGLIEALSESEANVLVTGETGSGKGAVAAAIHAHSPRRDGPFVVVDVGAIPGELLESELFGHTKGAFTGAHRDRAGQIELAAGGTLFLDEIGDMPLPLQGKLLRLVEEREFRRLGDSAARHMDARIISATNVDLPAAIAAGRFREDLYYRLCVVPIELPPLRERPGEIGPLARHHLARAGAAAQRALMLSPDAVELLEGYGWPGNVRQLNNAIEYAVAMCRGQTVQVDDLPPEIRHGATAPRAPHAPPLEAPPSASPVPTVDAPPSAEPPPSADDPVRIRAALEAHRWNRGAAAAALGMSRTTLWRWMRRLGIA
ncbi:MAG: sigma 54-interacting transcriptional regulator [Myxococcota bacterium]